MSLIKRTAGVVFLSGLLASSALAAGPLPAGKPAGTQQAALQGPGLLWIGVAAIIAVTVAVVVSDDDGITSSTSGTGGAP